MWLFLACLFIFSFIAKSAPLDDFIAAPDPWYKFNDTGLTYEGYNSAGKWIVYIINMTSQQWLNSSEVDKPIWTHWLMIVVPENVKHKDFATVVGTGNSNSDTPPPSNEEYLECSQYIATHTQTIVAVLYNIPNEPLVFAADPLHESRSEDSIIAFGWKMFGTYNASDNYRYNWITHFAMAKAQVKAMDTVQTWAFSNLELSITRFAVAGASKRGWSTWLTAAADTRVVAFVPMVMDMANLHPNLHHMYRAYGGWTWAFQPYYAENITKDLDTEWVQQLFEACDPYSFFDRYEGIQKMVIDATNDEFFMPDDEHYWWSEFPEPRHFEMIADAEHSLSSGITELVPSVASFLTSYLDEISLPRIEWVIQNETGTIKLTFYGNTSIITDVRKWHGRSCAHKRRDFRIANLDDPCLCGVATDNGMCVDLESLFSYDSLTAISVNDTVAVYEATAPEMPSDYWVAFLIAVRVQLFHSDHPLHSFDELLEKKLQGKLKEDKSWFFVEYGEAVFTSQVSIVPQIFPFPPCNGTDCYGTLV